MNHQFKLEFVDSGLYYILFKMKIILKIRCYRYDPDPMKKVRHPDPAGQKQTDPT